MKKIFLIISVVFFSSCDKNLEVQKKKFDRSEDGFSKHCFLVFETLSMDNGDVEMTLQKDVSGVISAVYKYVGGSKKIVDKSSHVARSDVDSPVIPDSILIEIEKQQYPVTVDGGTTCSGMDCIRTVKECLDRGGEATISNGACKSYCVTCSN